MWTPVLVGRLGGCEAECNLCGKVCNTQAIRYMPLEEKKKLKLGKAVIERDLCVAWKEERSCYLCDEVCPYGAISLVMGEGATIDKPGVLPDKCTGCGLCEWKCPVDPPAIYVTPLEVETS
jgi:ferredoxin